MIGFFDPLAVKVLLLGKYVSGGTDYRVKMSIGVGVSI